MIASVSNSSKIVVEKSTVPVKTAEAIEKVNDACTSHTSQAIQHTANVAITRDLCVDILPLLRHGNTLTACSLHRATIKAQLLTCTFVPYC